MEAAVGGEELSLRCRFREVSVHGVRLPTTHSFDLIPRDSCCDGGVGCTTTEGVTRVCRGINAGFGKRLRKFVREPFLVKGAA